MNVFRQDLESKLLIAATCACIWGMMQMLYSAFIPSWVSAGFYVVLAAFMAVSCSSKGPHAVERSAALSVCFVTGGVILWIGTRSIVPLGVYGLLSITYILSAFASGFARIKQRRREGASIRPQPEGRTAPGDANVPYQLPMMAIRDMVVIPGTKTPFVAGRKRSLRALEYAMVKDERIFLATQNKASVDEPRAEEISKFGCVCKVLQTIKTPDGNVKVLVEGVEMAKTIEVTEGSGFFLATVQDLAKASGMLPIE